MRLINATTTSTENVISTHSIGHDQLKRILSYALPVGFFLLIFLLLLGLTIRKRREIFYKWNSFRQIRSSTNGIRRDSEFDSFNRDNVQITPIDYHQNQDVQLNTIS